MTDAWEGRVQCWVEEVTIPTYGVGQPDKNPMFLEKRVYQGSSGVVYPHPIIDHVDTKQTAQQYTAVFLENRYLRIMLLPALGGRVQMALDKTNGYHFVYYNRVIKPALVGLAGPWISGGIEFNWPQHHRPSTFDPVDYRLQANADGSQTVWFNEIERMFRTKGLVGFTLHPDTAYLELNVQLYNRTDKAQTFLWWANPAVHVNDEYQSVFPPDVHAVMDHGKRDVSDFPIATGVYYKMDYSPGTDISRYKNIPVPTSFMAYHSDFDFIGCYDHGRQAGMMHVANHHLVPGKKQWTWGNGDFGHAWDRQLTDEDGPYIELMCGAYTDNQPDFSWLQPGEEKRFTQIFMPYKGIGAAKNASQDFVINLEAYEDQARLGVYASRICTVHVELLHRNQVIYAREVALSPETFVVDEVPVRAIPQELTLQVCDLDGRVLLAYTPLPDEKPPVPAPATPAPAPQQVSSNDELFLHGLHLEQYRHATYAPEPYYEEALRRDPGDSRCNNALGLLLLRRGKFKEAERYFRRAIARLTMRNPNPYDGEAYYNLGQALRWQGRQDEAYDAFYKAVWSAAWRPSAYFELARIECQRGNYAEALRLLDETLAENGRHHQARHLKIVCLRQLNQNDAAHAEIARSLELDPFNAGALYEQALLSKDDVLFTRVMRAWVHNYIELALDYAHAGLYEEAVALLGAAPSVDPMVRYYTAWCHHQRAEISQADTALKEAALMPPDYCFPNQLEAIHALELAVAHNPKDGRAPYYLGNLWYAHRRYEEAIACWEEATRRDASFATPYRNLGLAYMNKRQDAAQARLAYERAFALNPQDARVFFELDQLYKKIAVAPAERLRRLKQHPQLVQRRDDLLLETITLLNILGQPEEALQMLLGHVFHPWEGGEGKISEQYVLSLLALARADLAAENWDQAREKLERARTYPPNLNEGKLAGAQDNHIFYYLGLAHEGLHDLETARTCFEQAARGSVELSSAMYYNDQPPDMIFYQGLARQKLDRSAEAGAIFEKMIEYAEQHMQDQVQMDYFAVSLPNFLVFDDDLTLRNRIHCHYLLALGSIGLGRMQDGAAHFAALKELDPNHVGAAAHRHLLSAQEGTK